MRWLRNEGTCGARDKALRGLRTQRARRAAARTRLSSRPRLVPNMTARRQALLASTRSTLGGGWVEPPAVWSSACRYLTGRAQRIRRRGGLACAARREGVGVIVYEWPWEGERSCGRGLGASGGRALDERRDTQLLTQE